MVIKSKCLYCHDPYKVFDDGDKIIHPNTISWWGIMANYYAGKVGTIRKINKCPACRRRLND